MPNGYVQTRVVHQWRPSLRRAYRVCRERNNFGIWESVRYAWWLSYGNKLLYPGEFMAWLKQQYAEHPHAFGVLGVVWAYAIIVFIVWTCTR